MTASRCSGACRAHEAVRPLDLLQVGAARLVTREEALELGQRPREGEVSHEAREPFQAWRALLSAHQKPYPAQLEASDQPRNRRARSRGKQPPFARFPALPRSAFAPVQNKQTCTPAKLSGTSGFRYATASKGSWGALVPMKCSVLPTGPARPRKVGYRTRWSQSPSSERRRPGATQRKRGPLSGCPAQCRGPGRSLQAMRVSAPTSSPGLAGAGDRGCPAFAVWRYRTDALLCSCVKTSACGFGHQPDKHAIKSSPLYEFLTDSSCDLVVERGALAAAACLVRFFS